MATNSLPKRRLKDATRTSLLQRSYYKNLVKLYTQFQKNLQPTMTRLLERTNEPGYAGAFRDRVDAKANSTIMIGAPNVIRDNITQAYLRGKKTASEHPRLKPNSIIIPYQLNRLDQQVVEDLRVRNFVLVKKLTEDMKSELVRVFTEGIEHQMSNQEIIRAVNEKIPEITRPRAKTIARTEISFSYNHAVSQAYQSVGIDKWQWLAALGYTCCEECAGRHGNIYDWGDQEPPLHPNCLCTMYPIVDKGFEK